MTVSALLALLPVSASAGSAADRHAGTGKGRRITIGSVAGDSSRGGALVVVGLLPVLVAHRSFL